LARLQIQFDCEWSDQKIRMVRRDMERDLRQYGGVSNISPLERADPARLDAPKPRLYLTCRRYDTATKSVCGAAWEAETFAPCPKCGTRQFVSKAERPPESPPPEAKKPEAEVDPLGAF
jgi:hypothetical protein